MQLQVLIEPEHLLAQTLLGLCLNNTFFFLCKVFSFLNGEHDLAWLASTGCLLTGSHLLAPV